MKKLLAILVLGLLWCNIGFANELIRIPVHVHILEVDIKGFKTKTKPSHVEIDFRKANKIWAKANILWDVKKIDYVPADTRNFESNVEWHKKNWKGLKKRDHKLLTQDDKIHRKLIQHSLHQKDGAINVYYLPYPIKLKTCGHATNWKSAKYIHEEYLIIGHTINPKSKRNKNSCIKRGIVVAHELGHMIHLNHTKGAGHLMGNRGGTKIPKKTQIEIRKNYKQYLENYLK